MDKKHQRVIFKERYYDTATKRHKTKDIEGELVGYDDNGNALIKTSEGVVQRNNYDYKHKDAHEDSERKRFNRIKKGFTNEPLRAD